MKKPIEVKLTQKQMKYIMSLPICKNQSKGCACKTCCMLNSILTRATGYEVEKVIVT